ncbi:MAG TPA: acetate--CoA ligase [Bacteroidia bacterium]|nr:acetate--CoA ligase [Bacteroidia bacterium]
MNTASIQTFDQYKDEYQKSIDNPEAYWEEKAKHFSWKKTWDKVLQWDFEKAEVKWFEGAQLNITENCLDRHLKNQADKIALIWESNDINENHKTFTYRELHAEVCRLANALKNIGAKKGDRICIYMPMVPELAFSVLACARIGAIHSVVFAGFSAKSLADRINDAQCNIVLTADGAFRGNKEVPLKLIVDEALNECTSVTKCLVLKRTHEGVPMKEDRDLWWHEAIKDQDINCEATSMNAEDLLFILYTSGSTGKPKGVVHTCAGYMIYAHHTFSNVFQYKENDIYWCTADIGWITGHSYIIYGPLLAGATTIMFEGIPTYPDPGRFWSVVDKFKVNIFYTAPTAIRALMACGNEHVEKYKLDSLRVLGTVGEPINEEAWHWYDEQVGKNACAIVDTWWQTETGGIMISPLAGITKTIPSYATLPLPGIQPVLVDANGKIIEEMEAEGNLCIRFPWPGMLRSTYGDHERCRQTYFSSFKGMYFTGDGAKRDATGNYRIIGRVDDVINVSGHRLGTAEVENAINEHELVIESAVVGYPHPIKGQGIYAFVICEQNDWDEKELRAEILQVVNKMIGPIAKPDLIQMVNGLPKTRSGKIMRRILRKIAENDTANLGDTSTLLDPAVVEEIKEGSLNK